MDFTLGRKEIKKRDRTVQRKELCLDLRIQQQISSFSAQTVLKEKNLTTTDADLRMIIWLKPEDQLELSKLDLTNGIKIDPAQYIRTRLNLQVLKEEKLTLTNRSSQFRPSLREGLHVRPQRSLKNMKKKLTFLIANIAIFTAVKANEKVDLSDLGFEGTNDREVIIELIDRVLVLEHQLNQLGNQVKVTQKEVFEKHGLHVARFGESFSKLAIYYKVELEDLIKMNPEVDPNMLLSGQVVKIRK